MVSVHKGPGASKKGSVSSYFLVVLILVLLVLSGFAPTNDFLASSPPLTLDSATIQDVLALDPEARAMRIWKLQLQTACQQFLHSISSGNNITQAHLKRKAQMESEALGRMSIPDPTTILTTQRGGNRPKYQHCNHVFIDLGTNRGDSIGCAVDASLDVCSAPFVEKDPSLRPAYRVSLDFPRLHLDVQDLRVAGSGSQGLSLLRLLQNHFEKPGMESVCVYGMEGNPYFTEHLQKMEGFIDAMRPRPLKHLHIHTETVVTSQDGPTSLFIDQYSEKNHFWGSSVLQSMPDIRRTTRQNNGTVVKANVDGISLSTLLRKTLQPFRPGTFTTSKQSGGSLLVKMDIEGAEFGVLKELAASQILCEYTKMGNNATLVVEFHQHLIKDRSEKQAAVAGLKDAKEKLRNCGVKFRNLPNFWT